MHAAPSAGHFGWTPSEPTIRPTIATWTCIKETQRNDRHRIRGNNGHDHDRAEVPDDTRPWAYTTRPRPQICAIELMRRIQPMTEARNIPNEVGSTTRLPKNKQGLAVNAWAAKSSLLTGFPTLNLYGDTKRGSSTNWWSKLRKIQHWCNLSGSQDLSSSSG